MLGEDLASRFDFGSQTTEDKFGRHMMGKRLEDDVPVSMTVLDPQINVGPAGATAVVETARKLAEKKMSSILHVIETGKTEGRNTYIVCEGASVDPLKTILRVKNGLTPAQALSIAYRVADTISSAAKLGINHLDISSSNVFVKVDGGVKVQIARFGFSHLLPSFNPTRKNQSYTGTAEYMAPEVCAGRPGDASADIYALGILLYEMVAGKPPFVSSNPNTTIKRQVYEKPLPLHLVKPGLSGLEAYENLVTKLLAKDPKGRPESMAVAMDLIAQLASETFTDADIATDGVRDTAVQVVSSFETTSKPQIQEEAKTALYDMPSGNATMAFDGLAEAVAAATTTQEPAVESTTTARELEQESRPTEAFDASFINEVIQKAKSAEELNIEQAKKAKESVPVAETPLVAEQDSREWFAEGDSTGADSQGFFPSEEQPSRKESKMFWVILAAVAILLVIAAVIYIDGRSGQPVEEGVAVEETAKPQISEPEKVVEPVKPPPVAEEPAKKVDGPAEEPKAESAKDVPAHQGEPKVEEKKVEPPPELTPAQIAAQMVKDAESFIAEGDLVAARVALDEAMRIDRRNGRAKTLLKDVAKRELAAIQAKKGAMNAQALAKKKAAVKVKAEAQPKVEKKAEKKAEKKEAAPAMSDDERNAKVKGLIKSGRAAFNSGNNQDAIAKYNQALKLDPGNKLAQKMLEQAKAKAE